MISNSFYFLVVSDAEHIKLIQVVIYVYMYLFFSDISKQAKCAGTPDKVVAFKFDRDLF